METRAKRYVLSIMSADRPGIVAAISGAIRELDGNIVALSQTVIEGYFTILVIADFPAKVSPEKLTTRVEAGGEVGEFRVMVMESGVRSLKHSGERLTPASYVLSAKGMDRKGAIHEISSALGECDINIIDIATYLEGKEFVLVAQIEVPHDFDVLFLQDKLAAMGDSGNFSINLQHSNIFKATNRI